MRKLKLEVDDYTYDMLHDMTVKSGKKIEEYATKILAEYVDLVKLECSIKRLQHRYEELEKQVSELEEEKEKLEKRLEKLRNMTSIRVVPAEEGYLIIHVTRGTVYVTSVDTDSGRAACVSVDPELFDSVTDEVKVASEKGDDEVGGE